MCRARRRFRRVLEESMQFASSANFRGFARSFVVHVRFFVQVKFRGLYGLDCKEYRIVCCARLSLWQCKQVIITHESVISRELSVDLNKW